MGTASERQAKSLVFVRISRGNRSAPLTPNFALSMIGRDGSRGLFDLQDAPAAVGGTLGAQSAPESAVAARAGAAGAGAGGVARSATGVERTGACPPAHGVQQLVAALGQSHRGG